MMVDGIHQLLAPYLFLPKGHYCDMRICDWHIYIYTYDMRIALQLKTCIRMNMRDRHEMPLNIRHPISQTDTHTQSHICTQSVWCSGPFFPIAIQSLGVPQTATTIYPDMAATTNLAFIQNMVGGSLLSDSYTASNLMLVTLRYVAFSCGLCVLTRSAWWACPKNDGPNESPVNRLLMNNKVPTGSKDPNHYIDQFIFKLHLRKEDSESVKLVNQVKPTKLSSHW